MFSEKHLGKSLVGAILITVAIAMVAIKVVNWPPDEGHPPSIPAQVDCVYFLRANTYWHDHRYTENGVLNETTERYWEKVRSVAPKGC